ncbi:hypothetical protein CCHL11_07720 [Colletotrichum chlorophyti]|uniref:Uncharacterized protein n=1 Tax=Colletotrichum chlorophyti TaxID=708187 RepID=A0A1Q8S717_9PEZI|nr:hypothetical protein CCHL11_07720 [Colletotrichum chlorophyti]
MSAIESQQYLKAILKDQTENTRKESNDSSDKMSGSFYESAFVIPHMQASAMPRRPRQPPRPTSQPSVGAMSSDLTLVDKDGVPAMSKEKNDAAGTLEGTSSSSKSLLKRILKKA